MVDHSSADARAAMIEEVGEEQGNKLYWLGNAFTNLNVEWRIFRALFIDCKERVDEFNLASGLVARYFSKALFESVLLGLCRITDPAETGRGAGAKQNLSLDALGDELPEEVRKEFEGLVIDAKAATGFARDWRNRSIAHADLYVATRVETVDSATAILVDKAIVQIDLALNFINNKLRNSTTLYSEPITQLDDERAFLRTLFLGNRTWSDLLERERNAVETKNYKELKSISEDQELPGWVYSDAM